MVVVAGFGRQLREARQSTRLPAATLKLQPAAL
jgi:hypothetical protein